MTPAPVENQGFAKDGQTFSDPNGPAQGFGAQVPSQPMIDRLMDLQEDIIQILVDFGAQEQDLQQVSANIQNAAAFRHFEKEVPSSTRAESYEALRCT